MEEKLEITIMTPSEEEKAFMVMQPVWGCGIGNFNWLYDDKIISWLTEGEATISYGGKSIIIKAGDFVIFPKGLSCSWDVSKPVKKHFIIDPEAAEDAQG